MSIPLAVPLAPDVWKISAFIPYFDPANCYLIKDSAVTLIDAGHYRGADSVVAAMKEIGLSPGDLDYVVYTHPHLDHIGGPCLWSAASNAEHCLLAPGKAEVEAYLRFQPEHAQLLCNLVPDITPLLMTPDFPQFAETFYMFHPDLPPMRWLQHGEVLDLGRSRLEVVSTPGHCPWHACLADEARGLLFSGDVLLVKGPPVNELIADSYDQYYATLDRLEAGYAHLRPQPGHGSAEGVKPIADAARQRLRREIQQVREALRAGPLRASETAVRCLPRIPRTPGGRVMYIGIIVGILEWLVKRGEAERLPDPGGPYYRLLRGMRTKTEASES